MGNPSLIAKLGLDPADFKRGLNASKADLQQFQEEAKLTAARIVMLEREMSKVNGGKGNADQIAQHETFRTSLRATQLEAKKTAQQLDALRAVKGGWTGVSRMGGQELGHVARSMGGSLAAGVPIEQGLMIEAPRLIDALGPVLLKAAGGVAGLIGTLSGLAIAAAAAAGGIAVYSADRDAEKQRLKNSTVGTAFNRRGDTVTAVEKELEFAETDEKETRHKRHSKKNLWANLFGRGLKDDDVEDIRQKKVSTRDRRDEAAERDAEIGRRKFDGDPSAEQDKLTIDFEARKTAIYATRAKDANRLVAVAKTEYETASAELKRRQEGIQNAVDLETQVVQIKKEGLDVENRIAAAKIAAAQRQLDDGPKEGPEHQKNLAALTDARTDATKTARDVAEEDLQRKDASDLAGMTGAQPEKERARLLREESDLTSQLIDPSSPTYQPDADKQKDLQKRLAENAGQLHGLDRSDKQREFQRREEEISANTGRGMGEQVTALDARLGVNADRQADNDANEKSADVASRLTAEAAELKRRKEEILFTEKQSLETLSRQGEEIQRHGQEMDATGKKQEIAGKYAPQIEKAEFDHDPAKAAQLRQNEGREEFNADVDEEMMTPAQKAERARHNLARRQATERVETRKRRHGEIEAANHPNLPKRPLSAPNRIDAIKAGAQNAGKGDGGFHDGNIVKGLQDVVKAVEKISHQNRK